MDELTKKFAQIKKKRFFWPQTLRKRFRRNPLLSTYLIVWAWFQELLVYQLGIKKPFSRIKTFWGDEITMALPHPSFLYFFGILGRNEIFLTDFIIKNLKHGNIFIDGGSNIGYYSLMAARIVGDKGQVHSFEPTPIIFDLLKENIRIYDNIIPNKLALWDKKTTAPLTDFGLKHSLFNSIVSFDDLPDAHTAKQEGRNVGSILIETTTIDTYCEVNGVQPDFIKLDTEGTESAIINGAKKTIRKYRPIISIEVWEYSIEKGDFKNIFESLSNQSYTCFQLGEDCRLIHLDSADSSFDPRFFNVVFIPE